MNLNDIAYYVTDKVPSTQITLEQYITTDNLLPQKGGRVCAISLPPNKCSLTHYQKGDVLVANIRPYLQKIWYADIEGGASPDVLVFRAKEGHNSQYVYACLLQDAFFNFVMKAPIGAKMPRGERNHILRFPIVPIDNEEIVGKMISNIDRKIALNRAMNEELEAMARQLYDYWFLQFDFPDANGKPYRSSGGKMVYNDILKREIPEGWEVKSLGELIGKLSSGKRPGAIDKSLKSGIPSLGAECIDELGVFNYASTPFVAEEFRSQMTSGLIEDRDILIYKDGAYVGKTTMFQDNFPYQEAFVNEHVFLLHCLNEDLQEYLLFTLKLPTYFEIMQSLGKAKAAQPGLNQTDLKSVLVAIPNDDLLTKFRHHIADQMHSIFNNSLEAENLRKLRDELLPLLMNGQVTIKE